MAYNRAWTPRPRARGLVLDAIRAAGTISRVELTDITGLTGATISDTVRDLLGDGLVIETGRGASTGGKPRTLVQLNPPARHSIGVQLERNTCVIVVIDLTGRPLARASFQGASTMAPEQALALVAAKVDDLLTEAAVDRTKLLGAGLVSYGPQDQEAGVLLTAQPTSQWQNYPIAARLAGLLALPVVLDNDAAAAAIGESWVGPVDPRGTYGCLYMASGIGGAVMSAGQLYRGSTSNTVEIGHITVDINGERCTCGNIGCLENFAGPSVLLRQASAVPGLARRIGLDTAGDTLSEFAKLTAAAGAGDAAATDLLARSARYLGCAATTMTMLFDVDAIVLSGPGFTGAAAVYQAVIQDEVDHRTKAWRQRPVRVVSSANASDAAAVGAAVLAMQSALTRRTTGEIKPPAQ